MEVQMEYDLSRGWAIIAENVVIVASYFVNNIGNTLNCCEETTDLFLGKLVETGHVCFRYNERVIVLDGVDV